MNWLSQPSCAAHAAYLALSVLASSRWNNTGLRLDKGLPDCENTRYNDRNKSKTAGQLCYNLWLYYSDKPNQTLLSPLSVRRQMVCVCVVSEHIFLCPSRRHKTRLLCCGWMRSRTPFWRLTRTHGRPYSVRTHTCFLLLDPFYI